MEKGTDSKKSQVEGYTILESSRLEPRAQDFYYPKFLMYFNEVWHLIKLKAIFIPERILWGKILKKKKSP